MHRKEEFCSLKCMRSKYEWNYLKQIGYCVLDSRDAGSMPLYNVRNYSSCACIPYLHECKMTVIYDPPKNTFAKGKCSYPNLT